MSNTVWTTKTMREDNLRVVELSFPNKFDYPAFHKINSITDPIKEAEVEEERRKKKYAL